MFIPGDIFSQLPYRSRVGISKLWTLEGDRMKLQGNSTRDQRRSAAQEQGQMKIFWTQFAPTVPCYLSPGGRVTVCVDGDADGDLSQVIEEDVWHGHAPARARVWLTARCWCSCCQSRGHGGTSEASLSTLRLMDVVDRTWCVIHWLAVDCGLKRTCSSRITDCDRRESGLVTLSLCQFSWIAGGRNCFPLD